MFLAYQNKYFKTKPTKRKYIYLSIMLIYFF